MLSTRGYLLKMIAGTATVAATRPAFARAADAPAALRVGVIPSDFAAQAYYAKDMGFFTKANINAEIIPVKSGPAAAAARPRQRPLCQVLWTSRIRT